MRINYFLVILLAATSLRGMSQVREPLYNDPAFIATVLNQHNSYRSVLHVDALTWSATLATDALAWAKHLASADKGGHDMSIRGKEGENIWWGTAGAYSYGEMVDFWGGERKDFVFGKFPDCTTRRSAVVGHYTQLVWKKTTSVGCALVSNGKTDYLVCRYSPPGNLIGETPY